MPAPHHLAFRVYVLVYTNAKTHKRCIIPRWWYTFIEADHAALVLQAREWASNVAIRRAYVSVPKESFFPMDF